LVVDVPASLFSLPREDRDYYYPITQAKNAVAENSAEYTRKLRRSQSKGVAKSISTGADFLCPN
jgi:hypothetical protein